MEIYDREVDLLDAWYSKHGLLPSNHGDLVAKRQIWREARRASFNKSLETLTRHRARVKGDKSTSQKPEGVLLIEEERFNYMNLWFIPWMFLAIVMYIAAVRFKLHIKKKY
jgi:hypothetical protein